MRGKYCARSLSISDVLLSTDDLHDNFEIVLRRKRNEALATEDTKLNLFDNIIRSHRKKGPTKRQTKKVPLPRVLKVPKALIAKKAVKVREVGIIAAAARLVSVMKKETKQKSSSDSGEASEEETDGG